MFEHDEELEQEEGEEQEEGACPSQEDLNEGLIINGNTVFHRGNEYFEWDDPDDEGERSESFWHAFYDVVDEQGDTDLRVFYINDHGNVTEYNFDGEVIGAWV